MTRTIFDRLFEELNNELTIMGRKVGKQISEAIISLVNQDIELANQVINNDDEIDSMQTDIEDRCIRLIAKEQPIATDLRGIFTMIKIVTDLERMADHAVDIARITKQLAGEKYIKALIDIPRMGDIVQEMIENSLKAYIDRNQELAYDVCKRDDAVDDIYKQVFSELLLLMVENPKVAPQATRFLFICKYLERVADHTTNICEWTIYLISGKKIYLNE